MRMNDRETTRMRDIIPGTVVGVAGAAAPV
jgi:hypothetical protein